MNQHGAGRAWARRLWGAAAILFLGLIAGDALVNGPHARDVERALVTEVGGIAPPGSASVVETRSGSKPRQAYAHRGYVTALPYEVVQRHYDRELQVRGWRPCGAGGTTSTRTSSYCKGEFHARLEYAGSGSKYAWTYAVDMSWGLR